MKPSSLLFGVALFALVVSDVSAQLTNALPGRSIVKLMPDYARPRVYALNRANGAVPGTLLALNSTNGDIIAEISVNLNPSDMAISPAGDALYVINRGSRTISKVDLSTFSVTADKAISTPSSYDLSNPLYVVAGPSSKLFYTDGAWGPQIYFFDFEAGTSQLVLNTGGNGSHGAGAMVLNRTGNNLFIWRQYGWNAGNVNAWVTRFDASTNGNLTQLEDSFTSWRRDPLDTPLFLDGGERWVFNKQQMFSATNVSILIREFANNIYGISLDGSIAFGPTEVFNTANGNTITNLPFSTTVQTLSGDQTKLFRYNAAKTNVVIYEMASIAPVSGPTLVPTPADESVVSLPLTNLMWTVSPFALAYDVYFGTNKDQVSAANQTSNQYVGRVTSPGQKVSQVLLPGAKYFWRVDVVGFSSTNKGIVWNFTASTLSLNPSQINFSAIAGYNPPPMTLSLTSTVPVAWSGKVTGASWMSLAPTNGTSPNLAAVTFSTAGLDAGHYTNNIEFTVGALKMELPVDLDIKPLNIVKMVADYQRPYIYALQAPPLSGQSGLLLFINTDTETIEKTLPIGINPVDLTIHNGEGRLYIASWTENATYVVDLATQTLLPQLHLGTDIYKINAGKPGRIITEGEDQWIGVNIVDTATGTVVGSMPYPEREGDGETDPSGTVYYHCDNNISNAHIHKNQITGDSTVEVASSLEHPYGSRNLVLSPDGARLFWRGYIYDANLNELGNLGEEIYATTAHGDLALGNAHVFNSQNGQTLYTWPFSTSSLAVSGNQQKVFLFNSITKQLTVVPMSSIASVPGPGLNPTPANGAVINPPLSLLSWTPSTFALSYRVFFGTNQAAIASANTNSPLYLGTTSSNSIALPSAVNAGVTYYWRVDSVGFSTTTTGDVWSFTVSALTVTPQTLSLKGVVGLPILSQNVSLSAPLPTGWTMSVAQPWLSASVTNGTTPSSVTLNFNTTGLSAGFYTNQLTITGNGITLQLPVVIQLFALNASKMVADPNRNYIYILHPGSGSFDDAFLLFLNTDTGVVEKVIPIGVNPTDMSINRFEDRLYVSNWQHNQTRVVNLATRAELSSLSLGTDVYKINGGVTGRIVIEGEDQWVYASLINDAIGSTITSMLVREGDGEFDPTGRYYYHVDNNSSGASIQKYDTLTDGFTYLSSAGPHYYYGSRNLVMSLDGSRLFWTSAMYSADTVDLGVLGSEIYGCSTNGAVAFSDHQAFDTSTRQVVYNLPTITSIMTVDRLNQRLWYFNSSTHAIESIAMSTVLSPSITQQPAANTSVGIGGSVYFSVTAIGFAPLSYQWTLTGTNLPGMTNYFLSMNNVQPAQDGDYRVIVSNPYNAVTSSIAHVTVLVPPAITNQPKSTNVFAGQSFSLSISASGSSPLSYRWTFEGVNIANATNSTLAILNAQAANEGLYRAIVQNSAGSTTSSVALVRVFPASPTITSGPVSVTTTASSNAVFSVTAIGSQPMSYQWYFNSGIIPGANASQYSIVNAQAWNVGDYKVIVANGFGSVTSSVATLTVTPIAPYFVSHPVGATLPAGTNLTLNGLARGSEPIGYHWQRDGVELPGAFQTSLTLTNLKLSDSGGYTLVAFNTSGTSTSLVASVTVTTAPPVFIQQPASTSVLAGSSTTLNSLATGSNPLRYQWFFKNSPLSNQTNRQLVLNPVSLASAGPYFVVVSNIFASATSVVAQVTVNQSPVLQQGLSNLVVDVGSSPALSVSASGSSNLVYTWQFNGVGISETNSMLTLTNIQLSQAGYYRVQVANQYGSVSSTGRVSIFRPPSWVKAWGDDSGGQIEVPDNLDDVVAVAGGDYHTLALRRNGLLAAWGYNGDGQTTPITNSLKFVSIAAGAAHNVAMLENGNVVAWGNNDFGQTNVPVSVKTALAIAAGDSHGIALLSSGSVVGWGDNTYGQVSGAVNLTGIRAITAGRIHNLALRNNGTVAGWGYNGYGETTPPQSLANVIGIAAGYLHSAALRSNGTVVVWGDNTFGQTNVPIGLSNVVAIAAGDFDTFALRSDGSVIGWGDNSFGQTNVPPSVTNAIAIAAGNYHGLALIPATLSLQMEMLSAGLVVEWKGAGVLQWASSPAGPFTDVSCQGNCYTNIDMSAPAKFFRLRR